MADPFKDDTLLARWLEGSLPEEEKQMLEQHEDFPAFLRIVQSMEKMEAPDYDAQKAWKQLSEKAGISPEKQSRTRLLIPLRRMLAAAAILVLVSTGFWLWNSNRNIQVTTGFGEYLTYDLPDGSRVLLNAGTTLKYRKNAFASNRIIKLKGEAFFNVESQSSEGQKVPFVVISQNGKVEVLGTQFNVFDRDTLFEVACFEGKVAAKPEDENPKTILEAGNSIRWTPSAGTSSYKTFETRQPGWVSLRTTFDRTPVFRIFEELERKHDIRISVADSMKNELFRGEIPWDDIETSMQRICDTQGWSFSKTSEREYLISKE